METAASVLWEGPKAWWAQAAGQNVRRSLRMVPPETWHCWHLTRLPLILALADRPGRGTLLRDLQVARSWASHLTSLGLLFPSRHGYRKHTVPTLWGCGENLMRWRGRSFGDSSPWTKVTLRVWEWLVALWRDRAPPPRIFLCHNLVRFADAAHLPEVLP